MENEIKIITQSPSNMSHNVFEGALVESSSPDDTLIIWAMRYLNLEVVGVRSPHTLDAKKRDLAKFFEWYAQANGHLMIERWLPRDTQGFLRELENQGRAPSTVNRTFATLRRFARWVHDQENTPFRLGLPTKAIKERAVDEPDAQKLDNQTVHRLLKAADTLVLSETRKNSRPRRNRAIFSLLLYTGIRPAELCQLRLEQYDGRYLLRMKRKGNRFQDIYIRVKGQEALNDYIENERVLDDPKDELESLFLTVRGEALNRRQVGRVVQRIAQETNKHRRDGDKVAIYPYQLRHTFAAIYKEKHSDSETAEALGHSGTKYVGRYGRKTRAEREQDLEAMYED